MSEKSPAANLSFTVEQFRLLALARFAFLEAAGFRRNPDFEETKSTNGSVVYVGRHIGFVFSVDIRDQCVDAQVVKICSGKMKRNWEGGYSSNLLTHLVKYFGYRGKVVDSTRRLKETDAAVLQEMIEGWSELLKNAGRRLLEDKPDSLPR